MGIPLVINPDAHSTGELALFRFGVDVARRGWLTKDDVFNTRTLKDVMKELKRRKSRIGFQPVSDRLEAYPTFRTAPATA